MDRDDVVSWRRRTGDVDSFDSLQPSDSGEAHVLAVDDSLVDRKVIERLLRISSFKVTTVESGSRALQFLGLDDDKSSVRFNGLNLKVDLIITDYCMPGMSGYDLLKRIKRQESSALREIPVVIMSSEKVLARMDRCLEEGAEEFIVKPVKLSDVKRLKGYMRRDFGGRNESETENRVNVNPKRKLREEEDRDGDYDDSDLSASLPSPPPCSVSSSPPSTSSSSPSPPSRAASASAPSSASSTDKRRLTMNGCD